MDRFWKALDWIGRIQIIQAALNYAWTLLPIGSSIGAGVAGVLTHQPIMWIIFASAGTAAFVLAAVFTGMLIEIWRNPQDKLKFVHAQVGLDLTKQSQAGRPRRVDKAQVMLQVRNDSHMPMSVILENAESSLNDKKPPRGIFPRSPSTIGAAGAFFVMDDPIEMGKSSCGNMVGDVDFKIRYGHPGDEKYKLNVKGQISVIMENTGIVRGIWFNNAI